jgi:flavorubredoxin
MTCMCSYWLVPSSMSKVLIVYDSRLGNTKLTAKAIGEGEREKRIWMRKLKGNDRG